MVSPPLFRQSLSVGGDSCCAAVAVVLPTTCPFPRDTQPPWLLPLSHRHNHLATVSVAVERTGILGLAPLSRGSLSSIHTKGFGSGIRGCRHPLCLPVVACISTLRAKPCRPCGGWCGKLPDVPLFIVVCECAITNFERHFFFYTAKLRLGSICKVRRCFSRNLHPCG